MSKDAVDDACKAALELIGDNKPVRDAVQEAFDAYDDAVDAAELAGGDDDEDAIEHESSIEEAAHRVCDAVERPVGKMTFSIMRPEEFNVAVLGLHDAIGRKI